MIFKTGALVAITGIDPNVIRRIARVMKDDGGSTVTVETDDEIESAVWIEHDLPTLDPAVLDVPRERLRPIIE